MRINRYFLKLVLLILLIGVFYQLRISKAAEIENLHYLGTPVNAGNHNDFSETNEIDKDDPHYDWQLGKFFVRGYSQMVEDTKGRKFFLKNVGDKVELSFNLLQDIDKLNGKEELVISAETAGSDQHFQVEPMDFGRGTLIIRHTDFQNNKGKPQIYTNYLVGKTKNANTTVQLCEEGDYEVALDYEVEKKKAFFLPNEYNEYRIYFEFSVRNGNSMVFPKDVLTDSELRNTSFTENGFYLDLAKSHYLKTDVKYDVLKEGASGYETDTRFNRPAKDGEQFTEEGIYTISVTTDFSAEPTIKKIYVGKDSILKAYVTTGLSINEIKSQVENGATISENGTLTAVSTAIVNGSNEPNEDLESLSDAGETSSEDSSNSSVEPISETTSNTIEEGFTIRWEWICIAILVLIVLILILVIKYKNKTIKKLKELNDKGNTLYESIDSKGDSNDE